MWPVCMLHSADVFRCQRGDTQRDSLPYRLLPLILGDECQGSATTASRARDAQGPPLSAVSKQYWSQDRLSPYPAKRGHHKPSLWIELDLVFQEKRTTGNVIRKIGHLLGFTPFLWFGRTILVCRISKGPEFLLLHFFMCALLP